MNITVDLKRLCFSDLKNKDPNFVTEKQHFLRLRRTLFFLSTAAKMMVYLDSSTETKAAELAAALDESLENRTIQVH